MTDHRIGQFLQVITIVVIATSGLALGILKSGLDYTKIIKQPTPKNAKFQNAVPAPAKNLIVEVPQTWQGQTIYHAQLKPNQKVIALTFDDGPNPKHTVQILDILKKNHVKATFFVVGAMMQTYPQIAKQVVAEGHELGNHTWNHSYRRMDRPTAASEIDRTGDIIYQNTGVKTALFRPPGGYLNNGLADYAKNQKYVVMMWSSLCGDADRHTPQVAGMVNNVLRTAKPGAIVLLHDGGGNRSRTVKALPQIIAGLKAKGYKFVTGSELLEIQAKEQATTIKAVPAVKKDGKSQ
ncbi:polysaccharide deacetylase family protein [Tolypothrix sp. FACHB-123]|uniref:polysaccharide deacetylase family protein n=1 Tax=Tolypothrix sp. FACHB-123 TaxID=2692868 RepID=UPI001683A1DF|nr:polysaccharide deacetylase family protein [Tolypothrix sp. FACHB-123]MBD2354251.1 polysaccharide deacetylase family protein [Tolypothrix sp. FACHB-123]